jgi:coenzyme F420-reducing hydrogenase gamma subunit
VDFHIRGCPPLTKDIVAILNELLLGKIPFTPDYPVCVECKMKENPCTFDLGQVCLGPITRAGCGAWCPSYHDACEGCRGLVSNPATNGHRETLLKYKITPEEILQRYQRYGMFAEKENQNNG